MEKKCTRQIVIGVVYNVLQDEILLSKRPTDKHMGGLWEFPGGKIEQEETSNQALIRELEEELDITPSAFEHAINFQYTYPDRRLFFHVFHVFGFKGKPRGKENQAVQWVKKRHLSCYTFPPASMPILSKILLPYQYAITGSFSGYSDLIKKTGELIRQGIKLIQFRANHLDEICYRQYAQQLTLFCHAFPAVKLLVKDDVSFLDEVWCDGIHLRTHTALRLYQSGWKYSPDHKEKMAKWLAVSCHNKEDIEMAKAIGAQFVTLSPVCKTKSHPEAKLLGFQQAEKITKNAGLPVYWLGGLSVNAMKRVRDAGGHGIAAISAFWSD
ncbi:MAG: Nudix family hydrolase [Endozoicomonadaceae bacterium]|nr:Nudix family hydrolase [Endozoicomonadaceae bacterium]